MQSNFDIEKFINQFKAALPFSPTNGQNRAIELIGKFIGNSQWREVFVLKGYAGTGKTNLVSGLSKLLPDFKWRSVLLAPTGRAAKVLSMYAGKPAYTIHKKIFKKSMGANGAVFFSQAENLHRNTVFIVDEASMIGTDNSVSKNMIFNNLLESLLEYVFSGVNCKLILVGDTAQLPPVGKDESPALNTDYLKTAFFLDAAYYELKEVARQQLQSGILKNATALRDLLSSSEIDKISGLTLSNEVFNISPEDMHDALNTAYSKYSFNDVLIVTRSNKRANLYNQAIRARVRFMEEEICVGDLMMVVKNNYYWLDESSDAGFVANGDIMEIKKINKREKLYGFTFLDCWVKFSDYPGIPETQVKIILESIMSDTAALTIEQQQLLFEGVMEDIVDEPNKGKRMAYLKQSPYFNALQVKFCYAVTCHKAQGGQWPVVFIDQGYINKEQIDRNYVRWLYTAFTRAREKVYLTGFSETFFNT